jgi:hypothetical protein
MFYTMGTNVQPAGRMGPDRLYYAARSHTCKLCVYYKH